MIIVTGGAGFIGSCVVRTLNDAGHNDIIIVDNINETDKWMNMRNKQFIKYVHKSEFLEKLPSYENVEAIIHMGAQSATTERNFDYLWENNFEAFRDWAKKNGYRDGLTIDRIDPCGNYEPNNCRWLTRAENARRAAVAGRKNVQKPD